MLQQTLKSHQLCLLPRRLAPHCLSKCNGYRRLTREGSEKSTVVSNLKTRQAEGRCAQESRVTGNCGTRLAGISKTSGHGKIWVWEGAAALFFYLLRKPEFYSVERSKR